MRVFDAYPLAAVLLGETAGLASGRLLADTGPDASVCALNAAEVVNMVARRSTASPREVVDGFGRWIEAGLRVVPLDWSRAGRAAELRTAHYHRTRTSVSLPDCGAIALAEQFDAELVTSDAAMIRVARAIGVAVLPVPDSSGRTPK